MDSCSANSTLNEVAYRSYHPNGSIRLSMSADNFPVELYGYTVVSSLMISVFGILGNLVSFCIHIQPAFRSKFNIILAGLAFFDILNLIATILFLRMNAEPIEIWYSGSCENSIVYKEFGFTLLLKSAGT